MRRVKMIDQGETHHVISITRHLSGFVAWYNLRYHLIDFNPKELL